jgi:hypothetical protein
MSRPSEIAQIEGFIGRSFTTVERVGEYPAFRVSLTGPRVVFNVERTEFPLDEVIETVCERCLRCHALGYTVFVGLTDDTGPQAIYAIADADPIRLMALFDVGSHNDFIGDTPARARRYMAALLATNAFVPYYMDAAGLKVRFIDPVSEARARVIAHAVVEFNSDAVTLVETLADDEHAGDVDIVDLLGRTIHQRQRLELWWD